MHINDKIALSLKVLDAIERKVIEHYRFDSDAQLTNIAREKIRLVVQIYCAHEQGEE
jgi:hypothetical protein